MKNYVDTGKTVTVTAPAEVESGDIVEVGALCGVAVNPAESGADVVINTTGIYTLPKDSSDIKAGDVLVVASGELSTTVGAATYYRAIAVADAGTTVATVDAMLYTMPVVGS
jgi:predicted RecA/RadA family phage recombinase